MIRAQHLSLRIGKKTILNNISFQLSPGEVLAVIGANGAGKSTLLKTIAGKTTAKTGQVWFNQKKLEDWSPGILAKQRAVLSQHVQLSFSFSVLETVLLGRFNAESAQSSKAIASWALKQVNLQEKMHQDVRTLSGGEQQRVHFARVLTQLYEPTDHPNAKYLLLDEPTASQDIAQQHQLLQLARHSAKELGYGVLIVLHDMNLAAQYVDRLLLLKQGQLLAKGTPEQVLTTENIRTAFAIDTIVQKHPLYDCLQVITVNPALNSLQIPA